jgi:hypothetical protein
MAITFPMLVPSLIKYHLIKHWNHIVIGIQFETVNIAETCGNVWTRWFKWFFTHMMIWNDIGVNLLGNIKFCRPDRRKSIPFRLFSWWTEINMRHLLADVTLFRNYLICPRIDRGGRVVYQCRGPQRVSHWMSNTISSTRNFISKTNLISRIIHKHVHPS